MIQTANNSNFQSPVSGKPRSAQSSNRQFPLHHTRVAEPYESKKKEPVLSDRLARIVLAVASIALLVSIVLYFAALLFGENLSRAGHSTQTKPLEIIIGNSVLSIPENVIRFHNQRHSGTHDRVEMYLQWPDMSGYSDQRAEAFNQTGSRANLLFLSLEPRLMSLEMSGRIEPIYSKFFKGTAQSSIAGLIRQPLSAEGGYIDEDLYYEADSPYPFAVRCIRSQSTVSTPFCMRDIHIGKDLMLTYRFHIKNLPQWLEVERSVRTYVTNLIVNRS